MDSPDPEWCVFHLYSEEFYETPEPIHYFTHHNLSLFLQLSFMYMRAAVIQQHLFVSLYFNFPCHLSIFLLCWRNYIIITNILLLEWKGWTVWLLLTQGKGKWKVYITFGITANCLSDGFLVTASPHFLACKMMLVARSHEIIVVWKSS